MPYSLLCRCACPPGYEGVLCNVVGSSCDSGSDYEICGHGSCIDSVSPLLRIVNPKLPSPSPSPLFNFPIVLHPIGHFSPFHFPTVSSSTFPRTNFSGHCLTLAAHQLMCWGMEVTLWPQGEVGKISLSCQSDRCRNFYHGLSHSYCFPTKVKK